MQSQTKETLSQLLNDASHSVFIALMYEKPHDYTQTVPSHPTLGILDKPETIRFGMVSISVVDNKLLSQTVSGGDLPDLFTLYPTIGQFADEISQKLIKNILAEFVFQLDGDYLIDSDRVDVDNMYKI